MLKFYFSSTTGTYFQSAQHLFEKRKRSGSGSIPLTNRSGFRSERPKNFRIRISNTDVKSTVSCLILKSSDDDIHGSFGKVLGPRDHLPARQPVQAQLSLQALRVQRQLRQKYLQRNSVQTSANKSLTKGTDICQYVLNDGYRHPNEGYRHLPTSP